MSHIAIVGAATGTGTFSIAAPAGSTDRTLTLPDSAGTLATSESVAAAGYTTSAGVLSQFNATGSAPVYACRAWVNFNGTGTVSILASGNVSSITDRATGQYTVNLTTAMPDANYCAVGTHNNVGGDVSSIFIGHAGYGGQNTASAATVNTTTYGSLTDASRVYVAIFR